MTLILLVFIYQHNSHNNYTKLRRLGLVCKITNYGFKISSNWDFSGNPVVKISPSNAGGTGSIPGCRGKIPHTSGPKSQNIQQKQYCNKFNKDFKNGLPQKKS